ncbi:MAG: excinuclease ABC subunit UvrA [Nitrospinota bacterium]|nr:excinuclease ABC subunit UvrA [Nitrospinota bacterium]
MEDIVIEGAREHNLKNITLRLPREQFIVVTGPSGSGKSSLAFDIIYAEGHRRYVESLSTYARQFLERVDKPDVDSIEGISPAIAIEQHNPVKHSRSTVGTASEIYDYIRLLFAKAGDIHCPDCGKPVRPSTVDSAAACVLEEHTAERGFVLYRLPGVFREDLEDRFSALVAQGFIRAMVAGEVAKIGPDLADRIRELADPAPVSNSVSKPAPAAKKKTRAKKKTAPKSPKKKTRKSAENEENGNGALSIPVYIVVDRLSFAEKSLARLGESLEIAFREGEGHAYVQVVDGPMLFFSQRLECCGRTFETPIPPSFSFNNPHGACVECGGFGNTLNFDESLIIRDPKRTLAQGAIEPWTRPRYRRNFGQQLIAAAEEEGLEIHRPWSDLPEKQKKMVLEGSKNLLGVYPFFERLRRKKYKVWVRVFIRRYQSLRTCPVCGGTRLRPEALWVRVAKKNIGEFCAMPVGELRKFIRDVKLSPEQKARGEDILAQVRERLDFLHHVGLDYLTLDRETRTLSGGEHQRINLASQLGAHLTGTLYILDEPTIGLHPRDNTKLIEILKGLVDRGNTLLLVEHDRDMITESDYVVDLGPGAGECGGEVVFSGPYEDLAGCEDSVTAKYLANARRILPRRPRDRVDQDGRRVSLIGASENNLKKVDLHVPLGKLVAVTGVSGSGKSTLIHDTLYPALARLLHEAKDPIGRFRNIHGIENISSVVLLDQSPIGKSPRSNPLTYIKAYDPVRRQFAETQTARTYGYGPGHFSFNSAGGRCEACSGSGHQKIEMHFMADIFIRCPECEGKRFKPQILEVRYKGMNIHEVLSLTVDEGILFFDHIPSIVNKLLTLREVGLSYMRLGQPVNTLSGGEAQRLKIAGQLLSKPPRDVLYLMDEPTTGLHFQDVERLLEVLLRLVALGNTVVVVEHHLDMILAADWVIDLGPEGGEGGGRIVAEGTPKEVARSKNSHTGAYLKAYLEQQQAV